MKKLLFPILLLCLIALTGCSSLGSGSSEKTDAEPKTYPLKHSSKYYAEAVEVDPIIFTTTGTENNLQGAVYLLEGTVAELFTEKTEDESIKGFYLDTKDGRILVSDLYTALTSSFLGALYAEEDADYTLPTRGEKIKVYVTYAGFSEKYKMPSCYFGASEYLVEDALDDRAVEVKLETIAQYAYRSEYGIFDTHFIAVKNNGASVLKITSSTYAYDKDGNLLGMASGSVSSVGPGGIALLTESFDVQGSIASYETTLTAEKSNHRACEPYLSYEKKDIPNGAIFQVTNSGTEKILFVKGTVLFLKDGKVVDYDYHYFGASSIDAGTTESTQFDTRKEFDTIEFYLEGDLY